MNFTTTYGGVGSRIFHTGTLGIYSLLYFEYTRRFFFYDKGTPFFIYYSSSVQNLKIEILLNTRVQLVTCYPSIGQCIFKLYIYVIRKEKKISLYTPLLFCKRCKNLNFPLIEKAVAVDSLYL